MRYIIVFFALLLAGSLSAQISYPDDEQALAKLENDIPVLMQKADIPGMSVGLIRGGKLIRVESFGLVKAGTARKVTAQTVFQAASLSKCVFAYGVLKLVDQGRLNLDSPLTRYLGNNYEVDDPRIALITARMVLSHTSGFPNWRDNDNSSKLLIHFNPGSKWSYSGEGIVYLSRVVSKITGLSLEDFMQQTVLRPLGMTASSYLWQDSYDSMKVWNHDDLGNPTGAGRPKGGHAEAVKNGGNAAASLSTNAADYAKFLIAVMNGTGLKNKTREEMIKPQIRIDPRYPQLAWGLGVGLETMPDEEYFWHWGDNGDAKAYYTASLKNKNAIVYFANAAGGLSIAPELLDDALGKQHPALAHLGYPSYNAPGHLLLKDIAARGAGPALVAYRGRRTIDSTRKLGEEEMNSVGYALARMNKTQDAVAVFQLNTEDYPGSWNVWDSLGEAMQATGDTAEAIRYYEKSLILNAANTNATERLKKLKNQR